MTPSHNHPRHMRAAPYNPAHRKAPAMYISNVYCTVAYDTAARAPICLMYVLTENAGGYKVYLGTCTLADAQSDFHRAECAQAVAAKGHPLTRDHAAVIFPMMNGENIRYRD
jgi:hypothetical protein